MIADVAPTSRADVGPRRRKAFLGGASWGRFLGGIARRMSEAEFEPPVSSPAAAPATASVTHLPAHAPAVVAFDRRELQTILNLYGRKVAEGEWKDYALDFTRDRAVFSIFRRAAETPLFRIEKDPRNARKQGAYAVIALGGRVLKRGPDLARVVAVLDRRRLEVVG